jgi:hypothetical protein
MYTCTCSYLYIVSRLCVWNANGSAFTADTAVTSRPTIKRTGQRGADPPLSLPGESGVIS